MKHFFSIIMLMLCLFVTGQSFAFEQTDDYDPVKVENIIYCDCVAYVHELPTQEVKEFATVQPLEKRQNETFGIFFQDGNYKSRDNVEIEKQIYSFKESTTKTRSQRIFSATALEKPAWKSKDCNTIEGYNN